MEKRKGRQIGTIRFNDMAPGLAYDAAGAIAAALNEKRGVSETYDPEFVHVQGAKAAAHTVKLELPLVLVSPAKLKAGTPDILESPELPEYERAWKEGRRFPPVVVDSRLGLRKMLREGFRRTCSAERAGMTEIEAVDVGSVDLRPLDAWLRERQE